MNGNVPEVVNYVTGNCTRNTTDMASMANAALKWLVWTPFPCLKIDTKLALRQANQKILNSMCGFISDKGSKPKQEIWSIKTHKRLCMNMTFTYFNIPIFRPNCPSIFLNLSGLINDDNDAKFCGKKRIMECFPGF